MTAALRLICRTVIVAAYVVGLSPWALFALTGFWGFAIIGLAFGATLIALFPKAKRDWNF